MGEVVLRAEDDAEFFEPGQVIGERAEPVAREIENLQGIGEVIDLWGKLGQSAL